MRLNHSSIQLRPGTRSRQSSAPRMTSAITALVACGTLLVVAAGSQAAVVTDLSQASGVGGNIDLTSGSLIAWGYDANELNDGFTNFKAGTTVATVSNPTGANTRDFGYTFTYNDGDSPTVGTTVASSGGQAGLLPTSAPKITFNGVVSSTETRRLTLYVGGYQGGNHSVDIQFDATLTGGALDEVGTQRVFTVNKNTTDANGGNGAGFAIATYTVDFTSLTETDLIIDVSFASLSGTRNWGLSGYSLAVIPEPGAVMLVGIGGLMMLGRGRQRRLKMA